MASVEETAARPTAELGSSSSGAAGPPVVLGHALKPGDAIEAPREAGERETATERGAQPAPSPLLPELAALLNARPLPSADPEDSPPPIVWNP
jgi:hypothetical protein